MPKANPKRELLRPLGKNIQTARKAKGLTQEKLAETLRVSAPTLKSWEKGSRAIGLARLSMLAEVLQVPVDTLLGLDGRRVVGNSVEIELLDAWRHLSDEDRTTLLGLAKKLGR